MSCESEVEEFGPQACCSKDAIIARQLLALPNRDVSVDRRLAALAPASVGSSSDGASAAARLAAPLRGCAACSAAGGSSAFIERRWPSNTAVSQGRSFSVRTAQIFAAAAASLSGPATSRSCMPSPLVPSLITMIGRSAASGAFDRDFSSPRHSARRPSSELAPPTSTPNSVRWTGGLRRFLRLGLRSSALAPRFRIGLAGHGLRRLCSRLDQFSGRRIGRGHHRFGGHQRRRRRSGGRLRDFLIGGRRARRVRFGGSDNRQFFERRRLLGRNGLLGCGRLLGAGRLGGCGGLVGCWRDRPAVATGPTAGAGAADCADGASAGVAWAGGATGGVVCRAIAPVTESSPCSSTVTREYSRSRSLFRVSMAEASRRASFWLSLATAWICCACRARSAAATWSRRQPSRDWLAMHRDDHGADGADAPRSQPPQRAAVELVLLGQKSGQQAAGIFGVEDCQPDGRDSLAITSSALPKACRITRANINRKCTPELESGRSRRPRIGFPSAGENTLRRRRHVSPYAFRDSQGFG